MIKGITGVDVVSLHHDISTQTGEEVVLFTLSASPLFRELKKNNVAESRFDPFRIPRGDRTPVGLVTN